MELLSVGVSKQLLHLVNKLPDSCPYLHGTMKNESIKNDFQPHCRP